MKPEWLVTKGYDFSLCPCCRVGTGKKGFLEKTFKGVSSFFREAILSEEFAREKGLLQLIDPRVKILTGTFFLVAVTLVQQIHLLIGLYLLTLVLAAISKINIRLILARVWFTIPLFTGVIALPAIFNVFVPGEALFILTRFESPISLGPIHFPQEIAITRQGITTATLFVMRVATSVSIVVLLMLTTRWLSLLKALRIFKVPQAFLLIMGMAYRYIHLLLRYVEDTHLARKSRTIKKSSAKAGQRFVASRVGGVLKRSLDTAEKVYMAMLSRGFRGDVKTIEEFRMTKMDYLWILLSIIFLGSIVFLDRW